MSEQLDELIDAIAECIVACAGRVNRDRAKAVLAVIEEQGWSLEPTAGFKCIVDGKDPCPKTCVRQGFCTWSQPPKEEA